VDTRYYIESDGRIFLVPRDGRLDLPLPEEVPFAVEPMAPLPGGRTWFCTPHLAAHPNDWLSKDDVSTRNDVSSLVREAVHASMPRIVTEGICIENGRVLLVKGNRGLTEGRWTLPGGFLRFGEHPCEGLRRELKEELGVDAKIHDLLAVRSKLGEHTCLHWILFFYRVSIADAPVPNADEIAEVRFFDFEAARAAISDSVMCEVIAESTKNAGPSVTEDPSR